MPWLLHSLLACKRKWKRVENKRDKGISSENFLSFTALEEHHFHLDLNNSWPFFWSYCTETHQFFLFWKKLFKRRSFPMTNSQFTPTLNILILCSTCFDFQPKIKILNKTIIFWKNSEKNLKSQLTYWFEKDILVGWRTMSLAQNTGNMQNWEKGSLFLSIVVIHLVHETIDLFLVFSIKRWLILI